MGYFRFAIVWFVWNVLIPRMSMNALAVDWSYGKVRIYLILGSYTDISELIDDVYFPVETYLNDD